MGKEHIHPLTPPHRPPAPRFLLPRPSLVSHSYSARTKLQVSDVSNVIGQAADKLHKPIEYRLRQPGSETGGKQRTPSQPPSRLLACFCAAACTHPQSSSPAPPPALALLVRGRSNRRAIPIIRAKFLLNYANKATRESREPRALPTRAFNDRP